MTRGERVIRFIEKFCRVPEGVLVGSPIKLADFQRRFILDVYDNPVGTKKAYLSIARKNAKTATIACLVLVHLVGPEALQNSQIVSGAMSRDQAAIVFNLTAKMISLNPDLADLVRVVDSRKQLFGLPMGTEYRALAAEAKNSHGLSPVLAILDEVGQVRGPRSEFVDAITTSQGAHEAPLLIAISTQAADPADLFSIWLDDAAASGDPRIVSHVYAAPADAELDDPAAWKAANPALGIFRSLADVEQQAAEAKRMPSAEATFRNLVLNQRVALTNPFMSRSTWEACSEPAEYLDGMEVFAGLDLSARTDLTALVLIGRDPAGQWHIQPHFWTPANGLAERARRDRQPYDVWVEQGFMRTTPGATVDYAQVAKDIAEITDGLNVQGVAFDRWRIDILKKEFDAIGLTLPLIEHGQGFKDMSVALDAVEAEFLNGRVRHGGHPVLTMCAAGAVVARDPAGGRKLDKSKATSRIDGMVALAMAFGLASKTLEPARQPDYQMIFL
ncbi:terminase large subunit [Ferribacterium limneticum]|uniref:terminase large subunit n=1 Tax=Ferribacterium limneticum TaxID=76259 RepID=UPI001CFA068B|nr:terminase TerL endonuclease subunit [Ferribacterium limneticum]UCV27001.1 terminase large subunit [Ferribacterium limneticum]UCV30918.1 terminase large subunit [Ferribacterium limneticum]